jgi:sodium/proline symporter
MIDLQLLISFVIYFAILLTIGIIFYRKNQTVKNYVIGNRSLNYWVTAISAQSSDMSSWLFMGYPALVFTLGAMQLWTAVGLIICMYLNWKFIAPVLRTQTETFNSLTIPTYLAKRFNDKTNLIIMISTLICAYFFTCYISSGLVGMGKLFESAFNLPYSSGVLVGMGITLLYTLLGGFLAVSWCNLFQGLFLLAMIILVPFKGYLVVGGWQAIKLAAASKQISLVIWPSLGQALKKLLILFGGFGIGTFGQTHILINFMGIKDASKLKNAMFVGIFWQIIALSSSIILGIVAIAYFKTDLNNSEHLFVCMARDLFPPLIAGFALCGMLAATLSTINTQLMVASSGLSEDLYPAITKQKPTLLISRLATAVIALVSLLISMQNSSSIYDLVHYAWSGLGCVMGPAIISALYFKNTNKTGIIWGMLTSAIIASSWCLTGLDQTVPTLIVGMSANFICIIFCAKLPKKTKLTDLIVPYNR